MAFLPRNDRKAFFMRMTYRRIAAALLVPLLMLLALPAHAAISAQASLIPTSGLVAAPMTCWVRSLLGSGQFRFSYEVFRDGSFLFSGPQESPDETYQFTPPLPGEYCVRVTVRDVAFNEEIAVVSPGAPVSLRPGPSVRVEAVSGTALKIAWGAVPGAAGYEVWRGLSRAGAYSLVKYVASASLVNTYLKSGTLYFYKVRSVHMADGKKVVSGAFGPPACGVPLGRAAILSVAPAGKGRVTIRWGTVPGATRYEIGVSAAPGGVYRVAGTSAALSLTLAGLTPGASLYVRVRAYRRVSTTNYYGAYSGYRSVRVPR
jgi:hypothetical protein